MSQRDRPTCRFGEAGAGANLSKLTGFGIGGSIPSDAAHGSCLRKGNDYELEFLFDMPENPTS
jgi:hypothetical protein